MMRSCRAQAARRKQQADDEHEAICVRGRKSVRYYLAPIERVFVLFVHMT